MEMREKRMQLNGQPLPDNWAEKTVKDIAPLQRGFDLPSAMLIQGNYPVVYSNGIMTHHVKYQVKAPGVVTGRSGTIGNVFFIEENYWPHNTALWVTNFNGNNPKFIFYVLTFVNLQRFATGSGVPTLNRNDVHDYKINIPLSINEQTAIATALSDTDALITSLEKLIEKKRLIKQGAMQELLTGRKRLPGFSGKWGVKRLGEIGKPYGGLSGKSKNDFSEGKYPYIPFMNIMTNVTIDATYFDYVNIRSGETQNLALQGDLFFNGSSETPADVGMCSVLLHDIPNLYLNSFCFGFRLNKDSNVYGLFLSYYFRSSEGRRLVYSLAQGATRYNLSKNTFMKLEIPLPAENEQIAIAKVFSDIDNDIDALEHKMEKYKLIKQGMMQELLTGKTRLV